MCTSHPPLIGGGEAGSYGSPEGRGNMGVRRVFVTWVKPRSTRHLSVLPSLGGDVFAGFVSFRGRWCCPHTVL